MAIGRAPARSDSSDSKVGGVMPNDKYAVRIYEGIKNFAKGGKVKPNLDTKGETTNHTEERFIGGYGLSPDSWREVVNDWYSTGIASHGDQANEALFDVSHFAHYLAARGPALYFALRAGHQDFIDTMVKVWKGSLAAFDMVSDPNMTNYAAPCSRLLDGADQRKNTIRTFRWLRGKKIPIPMTLDFAPDWLGLYAFTLIEQASKSGEPWARNWSDIKKDIQSAKPSDILPLKSPLVVERSSQGHVAYFKSIAKPGPGVATWAWMDYKNPDQVVYGVSVNDAARDPKLKGVKLELDSAMRACPGRPSLADTFTFPVAKG